MAGTWGAHRPSHAVASRPQVDRPGDGAEDGTSALLELRLPELRPLDEAHRRFLDQLSQAVAQRLEAARAQELEAQRAATLSELNTAKTHFLSTMSHELRTPLTLLLGPLHDVLSGRVDVLDRAAVEQLNGQCQRLLGMVEDLLEISIPLGDLPEDARAWERGVDELAEEDEDVADYVRSLEETRDTTDLPEASGEAIAREFERYLKRRGEDD